MNGMDFWQGAGVKIKNDLLYMTTKGFCGIDVELFVIEGKRAYMKEALNSYIETDAKLEGAIIGISIRSAVSGDVLYEYNHDIRLRPASNMKLLTAAAALNVLGEDYTFSTQLQTDGVLRKDTLEGNLFLVGKGDPTLLKEDFKAFAEEIKKKGIHKITGDIIGDDMWYDHVRLSRDLVWSDEQYYYGAEVSALTASPNKDYDTGSVLIEVIPTVIGEPPIFTISPNTDYVTVQNKAITVKEALDDDLIVEREHGSNRITISGEIAHTSEAVKRWMSVWGASEYAMRLFSNALTKQGISWDGEVKIGESPRNATVLSSKDSVPLSEILIPFMKLSNNGIAEMLIKEMGRRIHKEGSWEKGIPVLEKEMKQLGIAVKHLLIKDGSGISHSNLIPANEISQLLYEVQKKEWFPVFLHALPVAGHADRMIGGTLQERMKLFSVQAKTGTIEGVSTLSGYLDISNGERLIFSILVNNLLGEEVGKVIEDEIVERIVAEGK